MKAVEARQLTDQKQNELNKIFNLIRIEAINKGYSIQIKSTVRESEKTLLQYLGYNVDTIITFNSEEREQLKTIISW